LRHTPLLRVTALCLVAIGGLAGCASDDEQAQNPEPNVPAESTPATSTTPPTTPSTSPTSPDATKSSPSDADAQLASPDAKPPDVPAPPAAKAGTLAPPSASDRLIVRSRGAAKWRVAAQIKDSGRSFCLATTTLGEHQADPNCNSSTEEALNLVGSEASGEAVADVGIALRNDRNAATDLLVTGVATDAVKSVVIKYDGHTYTARLSTDLADVKIDPTLAKSILGSEAKKLPAELPVRVFGVSFPMTTGNPPQNAKPQHKHPRSGVMTLVLQ
jgi:hypothetical protein